MWQPARGDIWKSRLRWLAALFFVAGGTLHFVDPNFYRQIVPRALPRPDLLVVVSGICEIAGGIGLLVPRLRRWAGWGLVALLCAVFPANVYLALVPGTVPGLNLPAWLLWLRLPLQALLIAWVWQVALRPVAPRGAPDALLELSAVPSQGAPGGSGRRWPGRLWWTSVATYAAVLAAVWGVLHFAADNHWWATLFLFAPRWIWALPLAGFLVVAPLRRRWSTLAALALLAAGALWLAGVHCPWRKLLEPATTAPSLRVLTLNCDSWSLDPAALHRLIVVFDPDLVALQDIESTHLPVVLADSGRRWYVAQDEYMALASRYPIRSSSSCPDPALEGYPGAMHRYELDVDGMTVHMFNLHLMSPRWGLRTVQALGWRGAAMLQASSDGRRQQAEVAGPWCTAEPNAIVAGDFNTPPESPVFRHNFGRLSDAFGTAGWGVGSTYFAGWFSLRLDHILCDRQWQVRECTVGPDVGSEHRPLMAELGKTQ